MRGGILSGIITGLLLVCMGCGGEKGADKVDGVVRRRENPVVAWVDTVPIFKSEVEGRKTQAYAYGFSDEQFTGATALVNIIQDLIEYCVAARHGVAPTPHQVDSFARWVNENTRDANLLVKVKGSYGGETDEYKKIYLRPFLVNKMIRNYFAFNKAYHGGAWDCIEKALSMAKRGVPFQQIYREMRDRCPNLNYQSVIFSGEASSEVKGWKNVPDYLAPPFLDSLPANTLYQGVHDEQYSISIWYKVKRDERGIWAYSISHPKSDFDRWLKKEAQKLEICITDGSLLREIKNKYKELWWLYLVKDTCDKKV